MFSNYKVILYHFFSTLILLYSFVHSQTAFAQKMPATLSLKDAIDKTLHSNRTLEGAKLTRKAAQLTYNDARDKMYLPGISMEANSTASKTLTQLPKNNSYPDTSGGSSSDDVSSKGYPTSSVSLKLGEYVIFNSWKDKLLYDQASLQLDQAALNFAEAQRTARYTTTDLFFRLLADQEKLDAAKRSVAINQAIIELYSTRIKLGKTTDADLQSAQIDYLNAQNEYNTIKKSVESSTYALNIALADPIGTPYKLDGKLVFTPLTMDEEKAIKTYQEKSARIKLSKLTVDIAKLALELQQKERFPSPQLKFSGITLTYGNQYAYGSRNLASTSAENNRNLDVSASINLTVPIVGPGGFLGGRDLQQKEILLDQAWVNMRNSSAQDHVTLKDAISFIRELELNIVNLQKSLEASTKVLDSMMSKMQSGKASRLEMRQAINDARQNELNLSDAIVTHSQTKNQIYALLSYDESEKDADK